MEDFLKVKHIIEENVKMGDIPTIIFKPKDYIGLLPTIIFYHGWGSSKETQRFRAFSLSNLGYQVVIPDAIYHGERASHNKRELENPQDYFWPVVLNNISESKIIIDFILNNYAGDPRNMIVMGNSMGGFTASGIFTHNKEIKSLVVFNGSCNWEHSNLKFKELLGLGELEFGDLKVIEEEINRLDPMNNLELIKDRPVLLLHGDRDSVVSIESQQIFYEKIKPLYEDKAKIKFITYSNLNHHVTTNMLEEAGIWIN